MSSRTVYLRRRKNYTKLPDDLYYEANRKIGSSFRSGSRDVLRGLTPEEEDKYLPEILGVGPSEPGYRAAKQNFWADMSITVESGEGTRLEVGIDARNEPINLSDWITWKFAGKHSDVAANEEAVNDSQCKYFLHDPQAKQLVDADARRYRKLAQTAFIQMGDDNAKMRQVLRLLGFDTRMLTPELEAAELALEKFVDKMPKEFLEIVSDTNLEMKAFLEEAVSARVIEKLGNIYMDGDQVLGHTMKEAVAYLTDPVQSKTLTVLKARLEQSN